MHHYIPKRGDIIYINFDPQAGFEIQKRRPALVLSPTIYNEKGKLLLCCPITSTIRNGPWEILLPKNLETKGVILTDRVKSMDWYAREAKKIEHCPKNIFSEVLERINLLLS